MYIFSILKNCLTWSPWFLVWWHHPFHHICNTQQEQNAAAQFKACQQVKNISTYKSLYVTWAHCCDGKKMFASSWSVYLDCNFLPLALVWWPSSLAGASLSPVPKRNTNNRDRSSVYRMDRSTYISKVKQNLEVVQLKQQRPLTRYATAPCRQQKGASFCSHLLKMMRRWPSDLASVQHSQIR